MGRVDFYAFRFGNYLGGMNVSLRKPATLRVMNGESGTDLIAGGTFSGNVTLPACTTRLLYLPSAQDPTPVPTVPLLLMLSGTTATQTTLTWRATSGATSYTVKRGTTKGGPYTTLASGLTASPYPDPASGTNYYIVVGVNANGESYPSMEASTAGYANAAAPSISSGLTAAGAVGQPFSYTSAALNTPTSFAATGLPAGLSVNANTGDITGTPTVAGTASITISATNATGTDTKTLVLTVAPAPAPVLNGPATATGYVGNPFGYGVQATNTPTTYTANGLIHIVGAGTATISALQPGNDAYLAAPVVNRTLTVVQDLTVAAAQQMSVPGPYRDVTVQGTLTLSGPLTVSGTLTIASGGVLDTNCQAIAGAGTFTLAAGAELRICSASGISSTGASGAVLSTGVRSFSPDASYTYTQREVVCESII